MRLIALWGFSETDAMIYKAFGTSPDVLSFVRLRMQDENMYLQYMH